MSYFVKFSKSNLVFISPYFVLKGHLFYNLKYLQCGVQLSLTTDYHTVKGILECQTPPASHKNLRKVSPQRHIFIILAKHTS